MAELLQLLANYAPGFMMAFVVFYFWRDRGDKDTVERNDSATRNISERRERDEMWQKFWTDQRALDREIGKHMSDTSTAALNELSKSVQSLDVSVQALYTQGRDNNAALSRTVQELSQLRQDFIRLMGRSE